MPGSRNSSLVSVRPLVLDSAVSGRSLLPNENDFRSISQDSFPYGRNCMSREC